MTDYLTYRDLMTTLMKLPEEQLDYTVSVAQGDDEEIEIYPVEKLIPVEQLGVLDILDDPQHLVLTICTADLPYYSAGECIKYLDRWYKVVKRNKATTCWGCAWCKDLDEECEKPIQFGPCTSMLRYDHSCIKFVVVTEDEYNKYVQSCSKSTHISEYTT